MWRLEHDTYCNLHALSANKLHRAHYVLLHLHELRQLLREIRTERARVDRLAELVACDALTLATSLRTIKQWMLKRTDVALAEQTVGFSGGRRRRRVLNLRRRRGARLTHGVCAMHACGIGDEDDRCVNVADSKTKFLGTVVVYLSKEEDE